MGRKITSSNEIIMLILRGDRKNKIESVPLMCLGRAFHSVSLGMRGSLTMSLCFSFLGPRDIEK